MLGGTHSNPVEYTIKNDGFFPDILISDFQELKRVKADLAPELVKRKLVSAIFRVNGSLAAFKTEQVEAGNATLDAVTQAIIDEGTDEEEKELLFYYKGAIFNFAMGELHPELVSLFKRKEATDFMESIDKNRQEYYNESRESVLRILGTNKTRSNSGIFSSVV